MFSIKNSDTSVVMGQDKLSRIRATGAEVLCALDNSCLAHIGGLSSRARTGIKMMHVAEILASREAGQRV
jgi:L-lactate dehydrogenase complex protein LldE